MSAYVYIQSEPALYTVGFYDPRGKWQAESDHPTPGAAATRVHYLNGGNDALIPAAGELFEACKQVEEWWLREGKNEFLGAPHCIFAVRAAIGKAKAQS